MITHITVVAAIDRKMGIGKNNALPWPRLANDMKRFRAITQEIGTVVMGKNTALSLGKPLDGRTNYVLSRTKAELPEGFIVVESMDELDELHQGPIAVIGGAQVYDEFLPIADELKITWVHEEFDCDTRLHLSYEFLSRFHMTEQDHRPPNPGSNIQITFESYRYAASPNVGGEFVEMGSLSGEPVELLKSWAA